ncbi:MAG: ribosome biogenesis GTPase Der [Deltaproteobacteria bacterium]|nr:ribosome biogenesis GTPase Der [Deltaproteobacteria bacterium]
MGKKRRGAPLPAGADGGKPLVAIVGRPNVGKSTLFNKLARRTIAIVEDMPGVTRDRHYADSFALGREFVLVDTGGFDPGSDDPMTEGIAANVRAALEECDLVICVFDGTSPALQADREAVHLLRQTDRPVIFVANKADGKKQAQESMGLYELGVDDILPVSALHSRGLGQLEERIVKALPEPRPVVEVDLKIPRVAIVGRPNAGKSSLVNRLMGAQKQLVDDRPGTTVDSVDTLYEDDDRRLILIDTAGMRRKTKVAKDAGKKDAPAVEQLSVYQSIKAMQRSHVTVLMIDGADGVSEQDAKIAGLADDRGRALVIGLNKIDLMKGDERKKAIERTREILAFVPWARVVPMSAKNGRGTRKLLEAIDEAVTSHRQRIPTAEVNRFFEEVLERHPPPTMKNRAVRLYYVTQAEVAPPTFVAVTNAPDHIHFSYQRYVINQLRERFGFDGSPIRMRYRSKKDRR